MAHHIKMRRVPDIQTLEYLEGSHPDGLADSSFSVDRQRDPARTLGLFITAGLPSPEAMLS